MRLSQLREKIKKNNLEYQVSRVKRIHSGLYIFYPIQGRQMYFASKCDALMFILDFYSEPKPFYYDMMEYFYVVRQTWDHVAGWSDVFTRI